MSDLLPCPFCNDAMKMDADGMFQHIEQTAKCPIAQIGFIHRDRWNTRTAQAQIDAVVKAERERCRKLAAARANYLEDVINKGGGSKTLIASMKGGMIELRGLSAAIRKGEQP
jgi:hypothetical protein